MKKIVTLLVAVVMTLVAGCCTTHHTTAWEYKTQTVFLDTQFGEKFLNQPAKDGWEFISVTAIPKDDSNKAVAVFRRPAH